MLNRYLRVIRREWRRGLLLVENDVNVIELNGALARQERVPWCFRDSALLYRKRELEARKEVLRSKKMSLTSMIGYVWGVYNLDR